MQSFVGDLLPVAILSSAWTLLLLVNFKVHYRPQLASEVGSDLIRSPIFKDAPQLSFYAIFCGRPPSSSNSLVIADKFQSLLLTSIGLGGWI
jgi:hypothetical protein